MCRAAHKSRESCGEVFQSVWFCHTITSNIYRYVKMNESAEAVATPEREGSPPRKKRVIRAPHEDNDVDIDRYFNIAHNNTQRPVR